MSKGHMNKLEEANSGTIWVKWTVINSHELQQSGGKKNPWIQTDTKREEHKVLPHNRISTNKHKMNG